MATVMTMTTTMTARPRLFDLLARLLLVLALALSAASAAHAQEDTQYLYDLSSGTMNAVLIDPVANTYQLTCQLAHPQIPVQAYAWDLGDGTQVVTQTNSVMHSFRGTGAFKAVCVGSSGGVVRSAFTVVTVEPLSYTSYYFPAYYGVSAPPSFSEYVDQLPGFALSDSLFGVS